MVAGFNHNIRYKGELFHVQTEDSGRANPHIVTLLYRGGTIIGSAKTSYADIIKTDELELVVESIMKEQHQGMMRRLKGGEFDARLFPSTPPPSSSFADKPASAENPTSAGTAAPTDISAFAEKPAEAEHHLSAEQRLSTNKPVKRSLDEVILDYLITGEEK